MTTVLLVEDDTAISEPLTRALGREGYDVRAHATGGAALADTRSVDLVVLDLGLPDMDGLDVAREIRAAGNRVPILILTARTDEVDMVVGLDAGADDYVTKPFDLDEVAARVEGLLRRAGRTQQSVSPVLTVADLTLDLESHDVRRGGEDITLTNTEFELLRYLMENVGIVLSKQKILDAVWSYDFGGQVNVVELYISYLRKKIDADRPALIRTVRGAGYIMREPQ